ncbi:MAG: 2-C-methyl-D-erythritol 2,4-cyclodiphosphate synthase [Oscillospiraceae bacterium]|nr:2-C-methyl-D-erythritol 2,4-cyclodiphosphate synthase [Oscillospiraceae bacterium]
MLRIGHGYDAHRLSENRRLVIGGAEIPFWKGLSGHSDADVLAHAIADALLGAAALGDIGLLFPDTDARYKNADSMELLRQAAEKLRENGWTVSNIDATVIAQRPKLRPYVEKMRENIAGACGVHVSAVSVKATTEEGMGFSGREEGIAAHAVCLIDCEF